MREWKWKGSRWWKFDFHVHTPASDDYGKGKDQATLKKREPRDWLLDYMRAGIDCVAITDHNSGEWIDRVKEELVLLESERPEGFRPIHVFPGVEISVNGGIHLLAIFDCDKKTSDIDSLLGAVEFYGEKGSGNGVTSRSLIEVVDKVTSAGGIAIPAHVDREKGLFKKLDGKPWNSYWAVKEFLRWSCLTRNIRSREFMPTKTLAGRRCSGQTVTIPPIHKKDIPAATSPGSKWGCLASRDYAWLCLTVRCL